MAKKARKTTRKPKKKARKVAAGEESSTFHFRNALEVMAVSSTVREFVSNQTIHATGHTVPPQILYDEEKSEFCFVSEGPFGPRGMAGIDQICGNLEEGQQGMGANVLFHKLKCRIETSFELDGSKPVLIEFMGDGTHPMTPLEEWDGLTRVYVPEIDRYAAKELKLAQRITVGSIDTALREVVGAPQPYIFLGKERGRGKLRALRWEEYGEVSYVYSTPRCPGFLRRMAGGLSLDVAGDVLIPEDSMWLPGRPGLTERGKEHVRQVVQAWKDDNPFDPFSHFAEAVEKAQESYPELKWLPEERRPKYVNVKQLCSTLCYLMRFPDRGIPGHMVDSSDRDWNTAWMIFPTIFEGWERWVSEEVGQVALRLARNPHQPEDFPQVVSQLTIPEVLYYAEEDGVHVVDMESFQKVGMQAIVLFPGFGTPFGSHMLRGAKAAALMEYEKIMEGVRRESYEEEDFEAMDEVDAPALPEGSFGTSVSALEAAGGRLKNAASPGSIMSALGALKSAMGMVGGTLSLKTGTEAAEEESEAAGTVAAEETAAGTVADALGEAVGEVKKAFKAEKAMALLAGRAPIFPGMPPVKVTVSRVPAKKKSKHLVPLVHRDGEEPSLPNRHDLRLFSIWSYLAKKVREGVPVIQKQMFVALDTGATPEAGKGTNPGECLAYCVNKKALVLMTRAIRWVGTNSRGPKEHLRESDTIDRLLMTMAHEMAHTVAGDGHGPAFDQYFGSIWWAVSGREVRKDVHAILELKDPQLLALLPVEKAEEPEADV